MDVLERLNRRFGAWYEGLFGGEGPQQRDLRPRDILRRIIAAMEDARREGLDGQVYVPNVYTLQLAVDSNEERDYLRTFLDAEELAGAVARAVEQHGYKVKGALVFNIEELSAPPPSGERVRIQCRFDPNAAKAILDPPAQTPAPPPAAARAQKRAEAAPPVPAPQPDDHEEMGTVPAAFGPGAALASLVVRGADGRMQEAYPLGVRGAKLGRSRQGGNDIVLAADTMVSKRHAHIEYQSGRFILYDENSTNGTSVNGALLPPGQGRELQPGDEVRMGETTLLFRPSQQEAPPPRPAYVAPQPAASPGPFRLVAGDGETFTLASEMAVGRAFTSDIVLIGNGVASQHARLSVKDSQAVYVEDLNTPGGTFVNGERIPPFFPVALYEGDQVVFGEVLLRLVRGGSMGY